MSQIPILAIVLGYLLGSIPFGLILTQLGGAGDIRTIGSGNIGATNVLRTGRRGLAAATLLLDGAKGAVAVLLAANVPALHVIPTAGLWAGGFAVIGHMFPVWLRFKGGKGVATSLGVAFGLSWAGALIGFGAWILLLALTRYISLASMIATPIGAFSLWQFNDRQWPYLVFAILATVFVLFTHRANIQRLRSGTERRVGRKGATDAPPPSKVTSP
jgi:glycerol-3-phosphate acyltransferase PlsY